MASARLLLNRKLLEKNMICKCCGKEARWCGDDPDNEHDCDHIHCGHCKMHYSLEGHEEHIEASTFEEAREIMLRVYSTGN